MAQMWPRIPLTITMVSVSIADSRAQQTFVPKVILALLSFCGYPPLVDRDLLTDSRLSCTLG